MDFQLSDEQRLIQRTAREFAEKEIYPQAAANDAEARWPAEIMRKAWEIGLTNITVPEEYGGQGLGALELVLVTEQLTWGCIGSWIPAGINASFTDIVLQGTEEQKRTYLGRMAAGGFGAHAGTGTGAGAAV